MRRPGHGVGPHDRERQVPSTHQGTYLARHAPSASEETPFQSWWCLPSAEQRTPATSLIRPPHWAPAVTSPFLLVDDMEVLEVEKGGGGNCHGGGWSGLCLARYQTHKCIPPRECKVGREREQRTGGDTSTQAATTTPGEPTTSFDGRCGGLIFWPRVLRNNDVTHLPLVGRSRGREIWAGQTCNAQMRNSPRCDEAAAFRRCYDEAPYSAPAILAGPVLASHGPWSMDLGQAASLLPCWTGNRDRDRDRRQETGGRRQEAGWVPGSVGKRRRAEPRQFCSLAFAMSDFAMPGSVSHRARGHVHDVWSCCPRGMAGARWCKCAGPRFGWPVDGVEHLKAPGSASQSPRARLA